MTRMILYHLRTIAWSLIFLISAVFINTNTAGAIILVKTPNPVRHLSTITISIETAGKTVVIIFDKRGQEVVVLADEYLTAGSHTFSFDISKLPKGIYTCLISNNGKITTSIIEKE